MLTTDIFERTCVRCVAQAVYSGMEAVSRGTTAIESELDHVLGLLGPGRPSRRPPPPASKKLLKSLPHVVVDGAWLQAKGPGTACPVCTEELKVSSQHHHAWTSLPSDCCLSKSPSSW